MNPRTLRLYLPALLGLALLTLIVPSSSVSGQRQVSRGGHALDANLQLGSGGYNRHSRSTRSYLQRRPYAVGSSRQLYTVNRAGTMTYNPNNAFAPRSPYRATGYTGDYSSRSYHRRFRYQGRARRP